MEDIYCYYAPKFLLISVDKQKRYHKRNEKFLVQHSKYHQIIKEIKHQKSIYLQHSKSFQIFKKSNIKNVFTCNTANLFKSLRNQTSKMYLLSQILPNMNTFWRGMIKFHFSNFWKHWSKFVLISLTYFLFNYLIRFSWNFGI